MATARSAVILKTTAGPRKAAFVVDALCPGHGRRELGCRRPCKCTQIIERPGVRCVKWEIIKCKTLAATDVDGERAPIWDPHARGVFFGVSSRHGRPHFLRAVLEGVAYSLRHVLETSEWSSGLVAREVRVTGGGARAALWNQIKASAIGKPLRRAIVVESSALGAAMLAGLAVGAFPDPAAAGRAMVRLEEPIAPDPEAMSRYSAGYAVYRELYRTTRDLFTLDSVGS